MKDKTLNREQWEALKALLSELEDIEDLDSHNGADRYAVCGAISKDNMNRLRPLVDLEEVD